MNVEESDALVGIVNLQMPTRRGWIIRLDADPLRRQTISRSSVLEATRQRRFRLARPTGFEFVDTIPLVKRLPIKGADAWRALVEVRTA